MNMKQQCVNRDYFSELFLNNGFRSDEYQFALTYNIQDQCRDRVSKKF
jgi:hypothetical protein